MTEGWDSARSTGLCTTKGKRHEERTGEDSDRGTWEGPESNHYERKGVVA